MKEGWRNLQLASSSLVSNLTFLGALCLEFEYVLNKYTLVPEYVTLGLGVQFTVAALSIQSIILF
jgi:hypothetical protein